ncbi:MAG: dihydrofolate reductase [Bacteroidetes bacterium]|nr:MAG: dihydrofolate reductase [Bacteroidota bacterium]
MNERKVVLYISMSLDGFIARENDDLTWLSLVEKEGEDYGYNGMIERSDAYIVGRRTFEIVKKLTGGDFPMAKVMDCYVITSQEIVDEGVRSHSGNIKSLIQELKLGQGKDIYCDGGSEVVRQLMEENLIDEYIISIIPIILGSGIRLFSGIKNEIGIELNEVKQFESGLVKLSYKRV